LKPTALQEVTAIDLQTSKHAFDQMAGIIDLGFSTPLLPTCPNGDVMSISEFDSDESVNFQPNSWDYYKVSHWRL